MPVIVYRAYQDEMERLPVEAETLDDATLKTGHGVYTVFRLYPGGKVFRLQAHLDRMRRSAGKLDMPYPLDDDWLRGAIRRAVAESGIELPRIRVTVPYAAPETAILALEPFTPPASETLAEGVRVGLVDARRSNPDAKDSRFIELRRQLQATHDGLYELLLTSPEGEILEGAGSNFYLIVEGALRTARAGMLQGIARGVLLDVAADLLPVSPDPIGVADLERADEAFLTSSSRGVIPVVQVDERAINGGLPGPLTRELMRRYNARVEAEMETL